MPRANRIHQSEGIYHVTHRCHDREFLFKFSQDRQSYRALLLEGLRDSALQLLTYAITGNHIHLLFHTPSPEELSRFMQYVQGCFAQAYNLRKHRTGAFWSDRYHATMIESGKHLWRCMRYIDLNMIRAGAVHHPKDWDWTGWGELMGERKRNRLIDLDLVVNLLAEKDLSSFRLRYAQSINQMLLQGSMIREAEWSEAVAVGSAPFLAKIEKTLLSDYSRRRLKTLTTQNGSMILKEYEGSYGAENAPKNRPIVAL